MTRNNLKKEQLSEIIIGGPEGQISEEVLDTEEIKGMMYHQWKHPQEVKTSDRPDFRILFGKIMDQTGGKNSEQSATTQFLISEIQELKLYNRKLRRKIAVTLAAAATLVFLISVSGIYIMNRNQVFRKSYTENIAPKGQKSNVVLPDGTRVFLNSGTVLRYDNFFGRKYRTLELVGEAYFEVVKNEKLPFIIQTENIEVEVLGTKFNVMAYPEDEFIETIVTEGEVEVTDLYQQESVILSANQKATYIKQTREFMYDNVDPEIYISWKENLLTFDNENFANVIKKLERWYDVSITVEGTDSIEDRFTMTIKSESLREVLELISLTTNINFDIEASEVTIQYK